MTHRGSIRRIFIVLAAISLAPYAAFGTTDDRVVLAPHQIGGTADDRVVLAPQFLDGHEGNKIVLDLEPSPEFPRHSEGSFVALKSGRILFYYTQFTGGTDDDSPARIAGIHSDDGGRTWSSPAVVIEGEGKANIMSVSLLRLRNDEIAFFYLVKNSWLDCRPYVRFSADEAKTWSAPLLVVQAPGYFVLNNDRVVQLESGRLVLPVAFHRSRKADPGDAGSFDSRAIAMWYLSDDNGRTWREADSWWAIPVASRSGLQEPGVVELADGRIWSFARTDAGFQYGFHSLDAGLTWSPPVPTSLVSPLSPAGIKRIPGTSDLLAVYNDHSGDYPFVKGKRTPLVAAISHDSGMTWPVRKVIESDPEGWYCYTAIHFVEDGVLLAYCAGDSKVGGLNRLRIRKLSFDWLKKP